MDGKSARGGIQVCPGLVRTTRLAYPAAGGGEWYGLGSYGYNAFGAGPTPTGGAANHSKLGLGGEILRPGYVPTGRSDLRPIRENEVVNPSDLIAIGDAIVGSVYWGGADYSNAAWPCDRLGPDDPAIAVILGMKPSAWFPPDVKVMRAVLQRRHGGKWNVLFCDGHVESLTTPNLFDTRKASVRMRWNNDNRPDH